MLLLVRRGRSLPTGFPRIALALTVVRLHVAGTAGILVETVSLAVGITGIV